MKLLKTTTARFSDVVAACGPPQVYTLWQAPQKDTPLQTRIRQNRLMTILRTEKGNDFGSVGFLERKGVRYLQFPKSLKRFQDQRIIGIKWELVRE